MTANLTKARVYVACLASYNNGILHGEWIDANQSADVLREEIQERVLATSSIPNAEEWAIHDFEGFGGAKIEEYEDLETVSRIAALVDEHGEVFGLAYGNWSDIDDAERALDGYHGTYRSVDDYAEEIFDELYLSEIPEAARSYIDYGKFAHDLEISGDVVALQGESGEIHIFDRNF